MNDLSSLILLIILGFVLGFATCANFVGDDFDGQYSKAVYEWKLNKEKQNDNTKN